MNDIDLLHKLTKIPKRDLEYLSALELKVYIAKFSGVYTLQTDVDELVAHIKLIKAAQRQGGKKVELEPKPILDFLMAIYNTSSKFRNKNKTAIDESIWHLYELAGKKAAFFWNPTGSNSIEVFPIDEGINLCLVYFAIDKNPLMITTLKGFDRKRFNLHPYPICLDVERYSIKKYLFKTGKSHLRDQMEKQFKKAPSALISKNGKIVVVDTSFYTQKGKSHLVIEIKKNGVSKEKRIFTEGQAFDYIWDIFYGANPTAEVQEIRKSIKKKIAGPHGNKKLKEYFEAVALKHNIQQASSVICMVRREAHHFEVSNLLIGYQDNKILLHHILDNRVIQYSPDEIYLEEGIWNEKKILILSDEYWGENIYSEDGVNFYTT